MMTTFHDISYAQGVYNMAADPNPVVAMKMSGYYYGSKVGYLDVQAANNYRNAIRANKIPILYHYAGGGDPTAEADYFINACSPLADGDVYALDYELTAAMNPPADPANWCLQFAERVHQRTGAWPLFYTYASMLAEHNFSGILQNCGLWVADYAVTPDGTVPTGGHSYIIHQYTDSPLDTNALFIPLDTLRKYAYHAQPAPTTPPPAPVPEPTPPPATPPPVVAPEPQPEPGNPPSSQPPPEDSPDPSPTPTPQAVTPAQSLITRFINWLLSFFGIKK